MAKSFIAKLSWGRFMQNHEVASQARRGPRRFKFEVQRGVAGSCLLEKEEHSTLYEVFYERWVRRRRNSHGFRSPDSRGIRHGVVVF